MTTPGATNASLLWSFFTKTDGGKGKCNTCKLELANSDGNTTGMSRHLQAKHKKEWLDYSKLRDDRDKAKEAEKAKRKGHNSKDEPPKKAKLDFFKPSQVDPKLDAEFHDELINHIADTCTSFAQYGGESFQRVVSVLNKRVKVKHPVTLSRMAGKKAEELKKEICGILAAVKDDLVSLGFTTDMWTSRAMDSFLSLTVSFIDKYWVLHRYTPYVRHFPERHTGANISLDLDSMIEELGLDMPDVVKYSVNDNAANMVKAIRESLYLEMYSCDIHTMMLGIENTFNFVDGMNNVLKKSKGVSKMTHQSTSVANQQLKNKCKEMGIKYKKLKNPNDTRWNSQLTNMESVLHLKTVLQVLCEEDETDTWSAHSLTLAEWKLMQGAVTVLKPFLVATKAWEAEKTPTMNLVIERIYTLHESLNDFTSNPRNCRYGINFARVLKTKLEERFPNKGMDKLERCVANYLDKGIHLSIFNQLTLTKERMEAKWGHLLLTDPAEAELEHEEVPDVTLSPTSKLLMSRKVTQEQEGSMIQKEMITYEGLGNPGRGADILIWWRHNQEELPLLSKLARMILAIPASSAKSERVFSVGGLIVSCRRGSLAPTKVEQLIVLKENRKKVEEFRETSDYKLKIVNVNAFEKVIAHISEGVMEIVNIEYDDLYEDLDDVEDEDIEDIEEL